MDRARLAGLERRERPHLVLLLHLELRVRDRVAVRIVGGIAERAVDPRLELVGEDVLEAVGLRVHRLDRDAQRLGQVQLEQAVMADDLECDPLAGGSQVDPAVGDVLGEPERRQLLDHRAHRGG